MTFVKVVATAIAFAGSAQGFTHNSYLSSLSTKRSATIPDAPPQVLTPAPPGGLKAVCTTPTKHDVYTGRDPERVKVFDTTLRDGEQSPGCTMTAEEKMQVARQLARLQVDVIEAGFPFASPGDFDAVQRIANEVGNYENPPIICGLARATKLDIETCAKAVSGAKFPRIHTFIATSDIHMEHKLRKTREEVIEITREMVGLARSLCEDVEFSAEDALRSDHEFLYQVYSVAIEAGATTLNVPDTVGYTTPAEFMELIEGMRRNVVGIEKCTISVHGHDDLGMAVANFMAAIEGGARQVECTINGIGERAGNAALEEIVMALHVRKSFYNRRFGREELDDRALTNINTREIFKSSRLVSTMTGMLVQPNKAIVGGNAFAHESGIHQDGVLKNRATYEIMDAELVGIVDNDNLVLGKHSGRAAFRSRLTDLGYTLGDDELQRSFARFKELADKKKEISSADLESIVNDEIQFVSEDRFMLDEMQVICGASTTPTATVTIADTTTNQIITKAATGTGPVDAAYAAVHQVVGSCMDDVELLEYSVGSVTAGIDALGEVTVRVQDKQTKRVFFGRSSNNDILTASTQAYLSAINRALSSRGNEGRMHPQSEQKR
mmetsp:Transcript_22879/g.51598  ORF Transcript_22879/g.51598 Transcript_22879/m.51598 type:complete len:610 (+) Transcript_22879:85-1914(+)|eukprot:CAMPEP_0172584430 /NCGR_PEP_ID=MMETSP1068-20121228/4021_1 /TAXON_ID=35684 /ORGANISM="Pseudopedinella elastica, Strain CCMP716" /LENGTH=609 /DNA_ID=CAMNT_0013378607 /DNA_START=83 /DNA_END=1912 /DNA_ORIENTATION=-